MIDCDEDDHDDVAVDEGHGDDDRDSLNDLHQGSPHLLSTQQRDRTLYGLGGVGLWTWHQGNPTIYGHTKVTPII